jgi:hypothetical protein
MVVLAFAQRSRKLGSSHGANMQPDVKLSEINIYVPVTRHRDVASLITPLG